MDSKALKLEIRREVRRRIKELSSENRELASRRIFDSVEQLPIFATAQCIALYAALPDEVPTTEAIQRWHRLGRRVVLPRVEGDVMRFYDYAPEALQSGYCGIDEPMGDEECLVEDIDLIVVPARAFTPSGIRLGRGGGFYDKYMSLGGFRAHKTGVAFECQLFEHLPSDPHDILVDEVLFA